MSDEVVRVPYEAFSQLLITCPLKYGQFCDRDRATVLAMHQDYVSLLGTLFEEYACLRRMQKAYDDWKRITHVQEPKPMEVCDACREACRQDDYQGRLRTLYELRARGIQETLAVCQEAVTAFQQGPKQQDRHPPSRPWISLPFSVFSDLLVDCHIQQSDQFCSKDWRKVQWIHKEYASVLRTLWNQYDALHQMDHAVELWRNMTYAKESEPLRGLCDSCRQACVAVQQEYNDRLAGAYHTRSLALQEIRDHLHSVVEHMDWERGRGCTRDAIRMVPDDQPHEKRVGECGVCSSTVDSNFEPVSQYLP